MFSDHWCQPAACSQGKDLTRIKDFVSEHLPHVILIATASQHAEVLQLYMKKLADWMVSNNAQALSGHTETGHIDVMYMDQTVAQLWENSAAGREEFPDQPVLVRRGIALGRTALQGQLPIICSLAGVCSRHIVSFAHVYVCVLIMGCPLAGQCSWRTASFAHAHAWLLPTNVLQLADICQCTAVSSHVHMSAAFRQQGYGGHSAHTDGMFVVLVKERVLIRSFPCQTI